MSSSCKLMYTCYSLDYIIDISYHTPNKVNLVKLPTWAYHVYHIDPSLLGASIFPSSQLVLIEKTDCFFHHFWWDWLIDLDFFTIRNHEKIPMVSHVSRWNRHVPPVFHASNPSLPGARARSTESKTTRSLAPGALKLSGSMMIWTMQIWTFYCDLPSGKLT